MASQVGSSFLVVVVMADLEIIRKGAFGIFLPPKQKHSNNTNNKKKNSLVFVPLHPEEEDLFDYHG